MSALKVRKNERSKVLTVIKKINGEENFFEVTNDECILHLGSAGDGFIDSEGMGEVIDPKNLTEETRLRINKWFSR